MSEKKEKILKPILGIFVPTPELLKLYNLYELMILKNGINWFSSPKNNMQKVEFNSKIVGGWISNSKANEWGMTENQMNLAINKLCKPKGKNGTITIIAKRLSSTNKNKDHYKLFYGWEGSRRFIIFNPIVLKQIIAWDWLKPTLRARYEKMLQEICYGDTIAVAEKTFRAEVERTNKSITKISNKIKTGLKERKVNDAIEKKIDIPKEIKKEIVPKKEKMKTKEKIMGEQKTVSNEKSDEQIEREIEADSNAMQYSNIYDDPDYGIPEEYRDAV